MDPELKEINFIPMSVPRFPLQLIFYWFTFQYFAFIWILYSYSIFVIIVYCMGDRCLRKLDLQDINFLQKININTIYIILICD